MHEVDVVHPRDKKAEAEKMAQHEKSECGETLRLWRWWSRSRFWPWQQKVLKAEK